MPISQSCSHCGTDLPPDAPHNICPKCLLAIGLESNTQLGWDRSDAATTPLPPTRHFVPPSPTELAGTLPQLEILELIGAGGMGAVYKARQPALDRLVAVKILPSEVSSDPSFAQRFTREAKSLARLAHPHIVSIYDFGSTGGLYYFVMEYVDGANLRHLMQTGGLQPAEALAIVPQICDALQFAHDEGIVHRDIKPENILVDKRGRVKIADFGLARLLGGATRDVSLTETNQVLGTLHYMAPEQIQGSREVDHRADIYSLGVVFYEMLTGDLPLGRFAAPSKKVEVDVRLDEVVLRSLETEPQRRYQQASQFKSDVDCIRTSPSPFPAPPKSPQAALESLILEKLPEGRIAALKAYREQTGENLTDARAAVEAAARRHGIQLPPARLAAKAGTVFAILAAMCVPIGYSILARVYPSLKPDLSTALIGAAYLGWLSIFVSQALRHQNTHQGWSASLILHANLIFVFLWLAGQSTTIVNSLYRLTGAAPGRSDTLFVAGFCLAQLIWIVPTLFRLTKRMRQVPVLPPEPTRDLRADSPTKWFHILRTPWDRSILMFAMAGLTLLIAVADFLSGDGPYWLFTLIGCNLFAFGLINLPRLPAQQ
jgi:serine/threonine protein kinase